MIIPNVSNNLRGTYVHPDIMPQIAQWISPKFAAKVSRITIEYFKSQAVKERDGLLQKKDDKIDELLIGQKKLIEINEEQTKLIKKQAGSILILRDDAKHTRHNTDILRNELDKKCFDVVIGTGNSKDDNMLIFVKNNDPPKKKVKYTYYDYTVFRVMRQSRFAALEKQIILYPDMQIVMEITCVPNSIKLWKNITKKLAHGENKKIDIMRNDFNIINGYTQLRLVKDVGKIFDERLKYKDVKD